MTRYEYKRGRLRAIVGFGSGQWWLVCRDGRAVICSAAGSTRHWGRRFWYGRMLVCGLARDWCAHGTGWTNRPRGWFGVPRTGVARGFDARGHLRWSRERALVRRVR